jgi:glutathione S-transferase
MTMKLYCFGESGNAYKAALTLQLAGVDWVPEFVDFFKGEARSDAFKAINAMGEVPALVDGDRTLTQSGVIQQYIVDKTGKLGGAGEDKYEVLRWVLWDNHKMSSQAGVTRFLMNFLPEDKRPADVIAFNQGRLKAAYSVLNDHLATRDWIAGNSLTIADISNCGYLFYD